MMSFFLFNYLMALVEKRKQLLKKESQQSNELDPGVRVSLFEDPNKKRSSLKAEPYLQRVPSKVMERNVKNALASLKTIREPSQ